jgi:uncharacterized protein (TIGR02678 family)
VDDFPLPGGHDRPATPPRRRSRPVSPLDEVLADERALGIRILLAQPILDATRDPGGFRVVARNREALTAWFEATCGWALTVDVMGGFARLAKRSDHPDPTRPARRLRDQAAAFDRRRYELLCLICAELASHAFTTLGILADGVEAATRSGPGEHFDPTYQRERKAFVDAVKLLESWGVVAFSSGEVDSYIADEQANAFVKVDTARLHRLLVPARSPSSLAGSSTQEAIDGLVAEPRYGDAPTDLEAVTVEARTRWLHHSLARRLLDDPVVYAEDLSEAQRAYLAHPSGRRWLRDRAAEAGLPLEPRLEGVMAIDPEGRFDDLAFPASGGTVTAAALLLTARFLVSDTGDGGPRRLVPVVSVASLVESMRDHLRARPGWAKKYQGESGAERLTSEALDLLGAHGLIRREDDLVRPMPAVARYRTTEPRVAQRQESLL